MRQGRKRIISALIWTLTPLSDHWISAGFRFPGKNHMTNDEVSACFEEAEMHRNKVLRRGGSTNVKLV